MAAGRFAALRRAGSFLALLAAEVGAVVLLSRLGQVPALRIPWHHLGPWLLHSPLQDVLGAILRMIALVVAWWLLSSNLLYLLASLSRIPGMVLAARWVTLPAIRRVTDHAVALTLATSIMGAGTAAVIGSATPAAAATPPHRPGPVAASAASPYTPEPAGPPGGSPSPAPEAAPAAAQAQPSGGYVPRPADSPTAAAATTPPPTYVPHPAGSAATPAPTYVPHPADSAPTTRPPSPTSTTPPPVTTPSATASSTTTTTTPPSSAPPTTTPPTTKPPAPSPTPPRPSRTATGEHTVVPGDNLWTISRDRLAQVTGRNPRDLTDHEIAVYWLRVIDANQSHLRSHNPNLIFPGEVIRLPPVDE